MLFLISLLFLLLGKQAFGNNESDTNVNYAFVAGRVFPPDDQLSTSWLLETDVHLKGAIQKGFIREDGSFVFTNVPPGSYIVEVTNPSYYYEPVRVEINSKGKIRARKVNYIQTSQVLHVPYPLKMKPFSPIRYFQIREQWRIIDFLFNPMVLMMVLPLLLVMLLPRVMNDPEAKKEMEQFNNLTKYDMPEMSEMITSFFGGGNQPKPRAIKQSKKSSKANS
ncbi:ER membrane protein complex subunit 7 [Cimex lectularius]|uniref:ER membrane protein complex subunit 7 beta-sandwich domain-containing protein n=1 Tax=Cimex lectularius TaxID=79782 RepID=A0A8I6RV77_CIMLE|nr:ER membrane protein complex subunit 7 [Cimex lectularius]